MPHPVDPYLDPETGILRNLLNAQSASELGRLEGDLTTSRTVQLLANDVVEHTSDLTELRAIHRHIFQDIYDWAGELRIIDMKRGDGQFFAPFVGIATNASFVFSTLRQRNCMEGLSRTAFIQSLADFYDQLNYIHPFRDGNGRVQRIFWSRIAYEAGWILDWRPIHGEHLDEVSRAAREDRNLSDLEDALSMCVSKR